MVAVDSQQKDKEKPDDEETVTDAPVVVPGVNEIANQQPPSEPG